MSNYVGSLLNWSGVRNKRAMATLKNLLSVLKGNLDFLMVSVVETIDSSICTELHCNILFVITCFRCCMPGQYGSLDDANFKREICQWLSQAYRIKDGRKTNEAEPEEHEGAYADLTEEVAEDTVFPRRNEKSLCHHLDVIFKSWLGSHGDLKMVP
ncbi:uncharacterized protein LOC124161903 [Ischnura elegans]|uniref:uncharacterized protein LOC124158410 n=1 Tax=Ischnura elegans TaxID=197161 RepID=UPI001ED8A0D3|nr:uncharacterized protein LOC124158410 [Ischnura elegans]XP_046394120.1 uncharacterized protein LOC124161903 [Ischnura elegans]